MLRNKKEVIGTIIGWVMVAVMAIVAVAPWVYHLVYCFKNKEYVLLIAGGVIPPIGWIHGLGAFFGWW